MTDPNFMQEADSLSSRMIFYIFILFNNFLNCDGRTEKLHNLLSIKTGA